MEIKGNCSKSQEFTRNKRKSIGNQRKSTEIDEIQMKSMGIQENN